MLSLGKGKITNIMKNDEEFTVTGGLTIRKDATKISIEGIDGWNYIQDGNLYMDAKPDGEGYAEGEYYTILNDKTIINSIVSRLAK